MANQEENPLQTQNKTFVPKFKNNVGRPKRKAEIIFSPPPKSIISSILCEEQKQIQENSVCELDLCSNESFEEKRTCEDCSDGYKIIEYLIYLYLFFIFLTIPFYFQNNLQSK